MHSVLVVEDSPDAYNLVKKSLGHTVELDWAKNLSEATKTLEEKTFDLILLDVILPDGDGYRLCSILQTNENLMNIPIIFLTAKNSVTDKVLGFKVGAEDYISKPFDPLELKARVEARLQKKQQQAEEADILRIGGLEINKATQRVKIIDGEQAEDIELTPIEFKLLILFTKELNKVFTRDEILDAVWGENVHVYNRSVDTHVSKLRKKLGPKCDYVESVHGSGYRFSTKKIQDNTRVDVAPHTLEQQQVL